jgi:DNA-binding transcriptional LysR family regulator
MKTTDLSELAAFDAVARHRRFRRASEERGVTASTISHAVSNLESRVGIRLLNRTTRSVSLTDAGAMLLARLSPAFGDIASALDSLNQFRETPFGKVRINAPNSIAPFVFGPVMGPLIARNPNLELEVVATDRRKDQATTAVRGGWLSCIFREVFRPEDTCGPSAARLRAQPLSERRTLRLGVQPFRQDDKIRTHRADITRRSRTDDRGRPVRCGAVICVGGPGEAVYRKRPTRRMLDALVCA